MEIESLRIFVEVMRRGSFAAVATQRNVDPSSVSRTIAALERELDARLFQRTTRRLAPTEAALAYHERVGPMIDELERAALAVNDSGETPRGAVRLTAPVGFAQDNLVPLLPELARRYPELRYELVLDDAFVDLVEERIDLAVRLGTLADSSLIAHRLCDMVYVACASPDYLRRRGRPRTPADLERHDCLCYPIPGLAPVWRFRKDDGPVVEVPVRGRVVARNGAALRRCAVAGMGILLLTRFTLAEEIKSGALVPLLSEWQATLSDFGAAAWMVYPSRSYLPRKVRALADFLKEKFKHGAPAEQGR